MSIPDLAKHGHLPPGIHECTLGEVERAFAPPNPSNRRRELWSKFSEFLNEISTLGLFEFVYIDGSFTSDKVAPLDIDVILEMPKPSSMALNYCVNNLRSNYVREKYAIDLNLVRTDFGLQAERFIDIFQTFDVNEAVEKGLTADDRKGILKVQIR